ncbi:hypothetical protein BKA64DRAFT_633690 [Cadophora sp. MPI-SDFR-AT-0126]|nr:hypothetical protein BKA64DRAFT_633690 [Leotiomycetes sp. MPI-SDFR-AT-0126]
MASMTPVIKYEWKFTCGHVLKQDDPTGPSAGFNFTAMPMTVSEDCVYCKEFKPTKDFTKSKAQIRKQDQQALAIYKSQVDRINKDIEEADGNVDLVNNLKKILGHCNEVWAEEFKKIAARDNGSIVEPGHPSSLSDALLKKFDTALSKVELLQKAELVLLERTRAPEYKGPLNIQKLEARCKKWNEHVTRIRKAKIQALGVGFWEAVRLAEKDLDSIWANVVKLMNDE